MFVFFNVIGIICCILIFVFLMLFEWEIIEFEMIVEIDSLFRILIKKVIMNVSWNINVFVVLVFDLIDNNLI